MDKEICIVCNAKEAFNRTPFKVEFCNECQKKQDYFVNHPDLDPEQKMEQLVESTISNMETAIKKEFKLTDTELKNLQNSIVMSKEAEATLEKFKSAFKK